MPGTDELIFDDDILFLKTHQYAKKTTVYIAVCHSMIVWETTVTVDSSFQSVNESHNHTVSLKLHKMPIRSKLK